MFDHVAQRALVAIAIATIVAGCDGVLIDISDSADAVRGSGTVISETRNVSGFDRVVLHGSGEVMIDVTGTESITIEAEDNIMPLLSSDIGGGQLDLDVEGRVSPTEPITYTITMKTLTSVEILGSGAVRATNIESPSVSVLISGSGNAEAKGTTGDLEVQISGSGNYDGMDLVASSGIVVISGSGSALVNVTDELDAQISGSGIINYLGAPTVTESITGSGAITSR